MLNAILEGHVAGPYTLSHEVSAFIYIYWLEERTSKFIGSLLSIIS